MASSKRGIRRVGPHDNGQAEREIGNHTPDDDDEKFDSDKSHDDDESATSERHMQGSIQPVSHREGLFSNDCPGNQHLTWSMRTSKICAAIRMRDSDQADKFHHPLFAEKTGENVIVDVSGPDDPYKPMNWPMKKKVITTLLYGLTTFTAAFASSVYSSATDQVQEEFGVSKDVATLGTALLLFGFGTGPLLWDPASEAYGRKYSVLAPSFISATFAFGGGAAKDIQTILICRSFQGIFSSAPITSAGGALSDIFAADKRANAVVCYGVAVLGGPTLGPIVGGAIVDALSWRWTQYITGIFQLVVLAVDVLVLDETHLPTLLVAKAKRLRHQSGNWALHAKHEEWNVSIGEIMDKYLIRPYQLLGTPICALVCLYAGFVYGILYATLVAFPIEFQETRGWDQLVGSLPFLALLLGIIIGAVLNISNQRFYLKRLAANHNRPVPEARLPPMMFGSVFFAAGLFVFAWTSQPTTHWICPCIGITLLGIGFFTIFQAALNYLIDTFQHWGASAVAATTFVRSFSAGALPLVIPPLVHNLGLEWGVSLLGFVAVAMIPIPYAFYVFGRSIRAKSKWSRDSVT